MNRKARLSFCLILIISLMSFKLKAASVTLTWDGPTAGSGSNLLDVDDTGGADRGYVFAFNKDSQTSTTDFIVSDGTGIAVGDDQLSPLDFTGNGLSVFSGPFANLPNVDQIAAQSDSPLTPITMTVNHTNLRLEEFVYVNNNKDYAILELRAVNQGTAATPVFLAVANDWDVSEGGTTGSDGTNNSDDANGFDATRGLIFQQSENPALTSPDHYSIGMASLNNPVDQFLLGDCCGLTDVLGTSTIFADRYTLQRHFLNNSKPKEECDDRNDNPPDGATDTCSPKCHTAVAGQICGNGTVEGDEECDDGNTTDGDDCDHRCLSETSLCGNGTLDPGEECDDGSRFNGNGCDVDCKVEFASDGNDSCGDGIVNNGATGEQVDNSELPNLDMESSLSVKFAGVAPGEGATAAFCLIGANGTDLAASATNLKAKADDCLLFYQQNIAVCGNGIQNAGEQCDDGNTVNGDGCESNCTLPACGNGILDNGEACDDGNIVDGDGCEGNCTLPACGNGILDSGETCDDGNTVNGDGCESSCLITGTVNGNGSGVSGSGCSLNALSGTGSYGLSALWPFAALGFIGLWRRAQAYRQKTLS